MSATSVLRTEKIYQIRAILEPILRPKVGAKLGVWAFERIVLLVAGLLKAGDAATPARIAAAAETLGITNASAESIERRVRRLENDPRLTAALCFHPLAKAWLALGKPKELILVVDPTTQDDRLVLLSVGVWYRGRTLPLVWALWPGQIPLKKEQGATGFWQRVGEVLSAVREIVPAGVEIIVLADSAFGCPAFTDQITAMGAHWHYVVRVQETVRCRDHQGKVQPVNTLVPVRSSSQRTQHAKLRGEVFKKQGWREASVVVWWGRKHKKRLCLVSDLRPRWDLVSLYRRRYGIEASFRDLKSGGWHFEQGQVRDLAHVSVLLVGIAIATWLTVCAGASLVRKYLEQARQSQSCRLTPSPASKQSLFQWGRRAWERHFLGRAVIDLLSLLGLSAPGLPDQEISCSWKQQINQAYGRAYVFHAHA